MSATTSTRRDAVSSLSSFTTPSLAEKIQVIDETTNFMDTSKPIYNIKFFENTEIENGKMLAEWIEAKGSMLAYETYYTDEVVASQSSNYTINTTVPDYEKLLWAKYHNRQNSAQSIINIMYPNLATNADIIRTQALTNPKLDNSIEQKRIQTKFDNLIISGNVIRKLNRTIKHFQDHINQSPSMYVNREFAYVDNPYVYTSFSEISSDLYKSNVYDIKNIHDLRIIVDDNDDDSPFSDENYDVLQKNFTLLDLQIITLIGQDPGSGGDVQLDMSMVLGNLLINPGKINSVMRDGKINCMYKQLSIRLGNVVKCKPIWQKNGMTYADAKDYANEYQNLTKNYLQIVFKDRNKNVMCKVYSDKPRNSMTIKKKIVIYQSNNHASDAVIDRNSISKHLKKHNVQIKYVDAEEMYNTFVNYSGFQCIMYKKTPIENKIYSWMSKDAYYILHDPEVDRKTHPTAISKLSAVYSDYCNTVPGIPKKHTLRHMFQNAECIVYHDDLDNPIIQQTSKMVRPTPIGIFNVVENRTGIIMKIDMNRAFTTYERCTYYNNTLMGVPMEEIYKCNNDIFKLNDIDGHVFVRDIVPHFSVSQPGTQDPIQHTKDCLGLYDGMMTFVEAKYWYDNGQIEIYAIIPSRKDSDVLDQYLSQFCEEEKILRNSLIGKFMSHISTMSEVVSDDIEAGYLMSKYKDEGKFPTSTKIGNKFIIEYKTEDFSHGKHQHIHNHIIGLTRIRIWQKIEQLVSLNCIILSCRVDSITYISPCALAISYDFRKSNIYENDDYYYNSDRFTNDARLSWKYEQCIIKTKTLVSPPTKHKNLIIDTSTYKDYNPILSNQFINLQAPAGFGKTYYIKNLFTSATLLAPTNCAAKLFQSPMGMTFDLYMEKLIHWDACPSQCIVIDEFSMISYKQFIKLDNKLRQFHRNNKPFGGIQIIISGDAAQLQPPQQDSQNTYPLLYPIINNFTQLLNVNNDFIKFYTPTDLFQIDYRRKDDPELSILLSNYRNVILSSESFQIKKNKYNTLVDKIINICNIESPLIQQLDNTMIAFTNKTCKIYNDEILNVYGNLANDIIIRKTEKGVYAGQRFKHNNRKIKVNDEYVNINEFVYQPAYGITSHLVQGMTLKNKICIYLNELRLNPNAFYVAVSRAIHRNNITFF